jgi:peptide/nickel transport system permease protein
MTWRPRPVTTGPSTDVLLAPIDLAPRRGGRWGDFLGRLLAHRSGTVGAVVVLIIVLVALAAPLVAPFDPNAQDVLDVLVPPGAHHLLGTDELGRDVLSRLIYGAQNSVFVGFLAVALGALVGVATGLVAGYAGGWVDAVISRLWDVLLAFPGLILALVVVTVLGPGTRQVAYAVALVNAPEFFRITRGSVFEQKEREYVAAAECLGAGSARIILRHLLPNSVGPLLVQSSLSMGFAIRLSAGLSFIGLGTQPPAASWGNMLQESFQLLPSGWWLAVFPGVALAVLLIGLNLLADGLRDVFDPRSSPAR